MSERPGPQEIILAAMGQHHPVAAFVGYSGGNDSLRTTHWAMTNIRNCQVMHINTGIGIERTRVHVRAVCKHYGWPLNEIRAKEDCGQDYDELVRSFGFPGPPGHMMMYAQLKERAIRVLVRRAKVGHKRTAKVMIISGVHHADSQRRMAYAGQGGYNCVGAQLWVNPFYWSSKAERDAYIVEHNLPVNPVTRELGMSGECGCGAFAQPGELARWRACDPESERASIASQPKRGRPAFSGRGKVRRRVAGRSRRLKYRGRCRCAATVAINPQSCKLNWRNDDDVFDFSSVGVRLLRAV